MAKINYEQAEQEVTDWLDFKRVRDSKREKQSEAIKEITEAVADGVLRIDEDKNIIHELAQPVGEEIKITELKYKPRLTDKEKMPYMKGVANGDALSMIHATIAALTKTPSRMIIAGLDTEDADIARNIALFFL